VTLWGGATASLLKPLVSMHKKALRVATGATYNAHSDPLFASINSLKFEDIYTLRVASMASSIVEKRAPPGLASSFRIIEPHENLRNLQSPSLYVQQCQTDKKKIMAAYTLPHIYNNLPSFIKNQGTFLLKDNFHLLKIVEYQTFSCPKKHCYSCKPF
jgi:hypothetical protein